VLNLGDEASRWAEQAPPHPADRWLKAGEGSRGMSAGQIAQEARWVVERLQAGQRVLVHCSAGMNRSASVCCGVLILLEGLSAEAALERLRQHHPWARPDPRHWLALRWLAYQRQAGLKEPPERYETL
jgi:protein-tyrosine phosphatase